MINLKKILSHIGNEENFTFVSIGANDGIFVDEVFQSKLLNQNWNCFFIEPVKETFDKLVKNYETHFPGNNFTYENYAIHTESGDGFVVTNKVDDSRGMCSFMRDENEWTERIPVKKETFSHFIEKNAISRIDFLKIDCEGMDYEIILQCFENGIFPRLILFEHISLSNRDEKIRGMKELLNWLGESDEYIMMNDIPEYQYEEANKLIFKKELNQYV